MPVLRSAFTRQLLQSVLLGSTQQGTASLTSLNQSQSLFAAVECLKRHFSSSTKGKKGTKQSHNKQKQQEQQQKRHNAAAPAAPGSWPQPARLVLPNKKATPPIVGRVPPSSKAAAAAAASLIRAANPPLQPKAAELPAQQADSSSSSSAAQPQAETNAPPSPAAADATTAAAAAVAYPWEVVAALPQSSPYTLERMSEMDLATYVAYLRDARLGMPSIFELGVAREQGFKGRAVLLRREQLLRHLLLQLQPAIQQQQQQHNSTPAAAAVHEATDSSSSSSSSSSVVTDDMLQELSQGQLEAAAAAAAAAHIMAEGATAEEVGERVLDYFVFKRCMQLMMLQRQHRQLMQLQHAAFLQQQQQQQDHTAAVAATNQPPFSAQDLADVDIWDAFFDADLSDYVQYLHAAVAGAPSVFTTVNPYDPITAQNNPKPHNVQQQDSAATKNSSSSSLTQQQQQQQAAAREALARTVRILEAMPAGMVQRPGLLVGSQQLMNLAAFSGAGVGDVVEVLEGFYKLKRLGFRAALQELMEVADEQAALERF